MTSQQGQHEIRERRDTRAMILEVVDLLPGPLTAVQLHAAIVKLGYARPFNKTLVTTIQRMGHTKMINVITSFDASPRYVSRTVKSAPVQQPPLHGWWGGPIPAGAPSQTMRHA